MSRRSRTPILAPHRFGGHAVMAAVGIGLWKEIRVFGLNDLLYLISGEIVAADHNAGTSMVSLSQLLREVYENVRATPFTRMHAAEKLNCRTALATAFS